MQMKNCCKKKLHQSYSFVNLPNVREAIHHCSMLTQGLADLPDPYFRKFPPFEVSCHSKEHSKSAAAVIRRTELGNDMSTQKRQAATRASCPRNSIINVNPCEIPLVKGLSMPDVMSTHIIDNCAINCLIQRANNVSMESKDRSDACNDECLGQHCALAGPNMKSALVHQLLATAASNECADPDTYIRYCHDLQQLAPWRKRSHRSVMKSYQRLCTVLQTHCQGFAGSTAKRWSDAVVSSIPVWSTHTWQA